MTFLFDKNKDKITSITVKQGFLEVIGESIYIYIYICIVNIQGILCSREPFLPFGPWSEYLDVR